MAEAPESPKSSTGLAPNIAALLCYLAGWLTGLIFFLIEKEDSTVKFHAMQSIITFGGLFVISLVGGFIPLVGWIISILAAPVSFILWIYCLVKAYQGEKFKLPIVGELAEKYSAEVKV